jgi:hypothetical protein
MLLRMREKTELVMGQIRGGGLEAELHQSLSLLLR